MKYLVDVIDKQKRENQKNINWDFSTIVEKFGL